jgi:hypothetical protein
LDADTKLWTLKKWEVNTENSCICYKWVYEYRRSILFSSQSSFSSLFVALFSPLFLSFVCVVYYLFIRFDLRIACISDLFKGFNGTTRSRNPSIQMCSKYQNSLFISWRTWRTHSFVRSIYGTCYQRNHCWWKVCLKFCARVCLRVYMCVSY